MGTFLRHIACRLCGSSDAASVYEDDPWAHCFACDKGFKHGLDGEEVDDTDTLERPSDTKWVEGVFKDIPNRKLREDICRKYGYQVGDDCHIAPYRDPASGKLLAQKVRKAGKKFTVIGQGKDMPLFGQHIWKGGKTVVVTEGEIDALSVATAFDGKWPAVSLPSGAQSAVKVCQRHYDWFDGFETILLAFDMDEPGQEAAKEAAAVLPVGKVKIMSLPEKDANEVLIKHGPQAISKAYWDAMNGPAWRPDGIVALKDIAEKAKAPLEIGLPWFLDTLTEWTFGRRYGEIYTWGAGTGVGKTDIFTQQIAYDVMTLKEKVGIFFLEQPNTETVRRLAGKLKGKAFHVPDGSWTQDEYNAAVDELADNDRVYLYNHFGQSDWEVIKQRIRFMHNMFGVKLFYVDHLTALADPSKERESLETVMAELAGMAQELGLIIHLISHLATPEGKSHEEGGRVMLKHFKGARAIGFWTFFAFGLERNKNHEEEELRNVTTLRCLKDRYTGRADGKSLYLRYDHATCTLEETTTAFGVDLDC